MANPLDQVASWPATELNPAKRISTLGGGNPGLGVSSEELGASPNQARVAPRPDALAKRVGDGTVVVWTTSCQPCLLD